MNYWDNVLKKFGVSDYHKRGIFGEGVSMYVIDTGVNQTESDLQNIKIRSFASGSRKIHGSNVTSIIKNVISPRAQIYLADVDNASGVIYTSALVSAIRDAISMNVDIITISLGTNKYDQGLQDAVNEAYTRGILVFAAAGNCSCPDYEFPAACEHAISVGSINADTKLPSSFNTRNDSNILFAPGENVQVPKVEKGNTKFVSVSGTSFSAPFVAGLAALVLADKRRENPGIRLEREDMINLLRDKDHLDLSCKVHNYNREIACAGVAIVPHTEPIYKHSLVLMLLALFGVLLGMTIALRSS